MITEELQKLYQSYTGVPAENITELPSSGSNRRYFRLTGIEILIGVYGASIDENEALRLITSTGMMGDMKQVLKKSVKNVVGDKGVGLMKKLFK